jgi:hypothetical protein
MAMTKTTAKSMAMTKTTEKSMATKFFRHTFFCIR